MIRMAIRLCHCGMQMQRRKIDGEWGWLCLYHCWSDARGLENKHYQGRWVSDSDPVVDTEHWNL